MAEQLSTDRRVTAETPPTFLFQTDADTGVPAENAVGCHECHRKNGRLEQVQDIYIPGRNAGSLLDRLGWPMVALTLLGVIAHGIGRFVTRRGPKP